MDDNFRIMNAIAPTEPAQQSTEPTRKAIELSEQTPLSGFDRKQKQVEAGEISDVGASIARVGQGRPSPAAATPASYGAAAVGWEETKAAARADEDDTYASGLLAESADAAEKGVHLGARVHERLVDHCVEILKPVCRVHPGHRAGVASMAWRSTRRFSANAK